MVSNTKTKLCPIGNRTRFGLVLVRVNYFSFIHFAFVFLRTFQLERAPPQGPSYCDIWLANQTRFTIEASVPHGYFGPTCPRRGYVVLGAHTPITCRSLYSSPLARECWSYLLRFFNRSVYETIAWIPYV